MKKKTIEKIRRVIPFFLVFNLFCFFAYLFTGELMVFPIYYALMVVVLFMRWCWIMIDKFFEWFGDKYGE